MADVARTAYEAAMALSVAEDVHPGLTSRELDALERSWGFRFAAVHRALLRRVVPVGAGWPDWREPWRVDEALRAPVEGVVRDVLRHDFWPPRWGPPPRDAAGREEAARRHLELVPRLVPLHGCRYLPAAPARSRAPVLSVWGSDVVVLGDLLAFLDGETMPGNHARRAPDRVPFWSDLADGPTGPLWP